MADDHDNDHDSDIEDRTPHKNVDSTTKDTPESNGDKNSSNPGVIEALQDRLKQLEKRNPASTRGWQGSTKRGKATSRVRR